MTSLDVNSIMQAASYGVFILFIFFGAKLQLMQMLAAIRGKMARLAILRDTSYKNLCAHIAKFVPSGMSKDSEARLRNLISSIAIPPVSNLDPAGIVPKMENTFKTYDKFMKSNLRRIVGNVSQSDLENVTNSLEVAVELDVFHRVVDHYYRLAKKGGVFMAYQLVMVLPMLMEMGEALLAASGHFGTGLPIGDGFGPMVAQKFVKNGDGMLEAENHSTDSETSVYEQIVADRRVFVVKAKGPGGSVGNPGKVTQEIILKEKPSLVVTIDAALRMESEKTGDVAEGVGVAMGGPGMDRFRIEEALAESSVPVLTVVCKMNMKEAISMMPKAVLDQVEPVYRRVLQLIDENSEKGQTVIVIGVGNTMGVE
jgi:hypothetical protein